MSAQHPDDPDDGRVGPYSDGEPVDPYASPYRGRQLPPPPPPHSAPAPYAAPTPYGQQNYPPHGQQNYPPYGYPRYGYPPYAVAPKSPGLAVLASFFIPGLGSMINGETGKGIGILVGYLFSALLTVVLIGFAGMLAFWIWGMVDGYSGAQRWNARHGILS